MKVARTLRLRAPAHGVCRLQWGKAMTSPFCDHLDRRGFLRLGSVAGLSLANILRLQASQPATPRRRDVNCIFIFVLGGMPHHDLWDFKADAPAEIRGDFRAINTNVPGIGLTDLLPH